jgi:hypothetical protein
MNTVTAPTPYHAVSHPVNERTVNSILDPDEDAETEAEDDLREIRTADDIDEPDPEDTDLWPLETGDSDMLEDDDDEE